MKSRILAAFVCGFASSLCASSIITGDTFLMVAGVGATVAGGVLWVRALRGGGRS